MLYRAVWLGILLHLTIIGTCMLISEPFNLTEEGAHDLHSLRQAPEESNQNFLQRIFEVTDG